MNITYAGHLDSNFTLASMGLSITMTNVFGNSFLYGIAGGFDTLGPQAFGAGIIIFSPGILTERLLYR